MISKTYLTINFCLIAAASILSAKSHGGVNTPPNIIYILADDLGYGEVGAYGQTLIKTPNLDALAKAGMRFTDHYSGQTVCAPSRTALMTGLHMGHAQIRNNQQFTLPDNALTVAEILKQAGYATGCIGKWGMGEPGTTGVAGKQGFDFFYGYYNQVSAHNHYPDTLFRNSTPEKLDGKTFSTDMFNKEALLFLDQNKAKPFYLYLAYTLPHADLQVPSKGAYANLPWTDARKIHAAMVSYLDSSIGVVIKKVHDLGLDSNTIIFFGSDNGPLAEAGFTLADVAFFDGNGPLRGVKRDGYDGGIRTPFIVRWPNKIAAGSESSLPSYFPDFLPTVCDLINYHAPAGIDGLSLAPTLFGNSALQVKHDYLYWEFVGDGRNWVAVRMGNWKVVQDKSAGTFELYDLSKDIGEKTNVAAQFPAVVDSIKAIMTKAHSDTSPVISMPLPLSTGLVRPSQRHIGAAMGRKAQKLNRLIDGRWHSGYSGYAHLFK